VLYNAANKHGPTGQPLFSYPVTVTVGVVPNVMSVVGTVVVNLCVAVSPTSMEVNRADWFTMATQIRPLNLAAAVAVNNAGGSRFLPPLPAGLPMSKPEILSVKGRRLGRERSGGFDGAWLVCS